MPPRSLPRADPGPAPADPYQVVDRELLLPAYKRFVVDPLLPLIPRALDPNTLTHLGHLCCLAAAALLCALEPQAGWPLVLGMLLLNAYVWLDNADGGHARRTGRVSLRGEVLDHGLDILNAAYMGLILARTLDAGPEWTAVVAAASTASMAVNLWEQAETRVFQLGRIQQVEFACGLSLLMLGSAWLGTDRWARIQLGAVTLGDALLACVPLAVASGMAQGIVRVRARGGAPWPVCGYLLLVVACTLPAVRGRVPGLAAAALATAVSAEFGARMLRHRVAGERARVGAWPAAWAAALAAAEALHEWAPRGTLVTMGAAGLFHVVAGMGSVRKLRGALAEARDAAR